ncbi:MAG: hypothetical protein OEQ25_12545 [Gammaproteobacteria bacterium]|nr:hypothetical protein [Gammaproteobacteria bacterium]MDH3507958.1 hypothetical protein [Gammaproteobacteria bacterium]
MHGIRRAALGWRVVDMNLDRPIAADADVLLRAGRAQPARWFPPD